MLTSTSDPGAVLLPQPGTAPNTTGSAEQDLRFKSLSNSEIKSRSKLVN